MSVQPRVNPLMFREYDIRGIVDQDLTDPVLTELGRSFGTFTRQNVGKERPVVIVGHDVRLSSRRFATALIAGVRQTGCDVIDIGQVPTPVLYFAVGHFDADGGVVVTASHNPPQFNGLKLRKRQGATGAPLSSQDVQTLRAIIENGVFATGDGGLREADAVTPYLAYIKERVRLQRPVKMVLDCGNGVTGPVAVAAFKAIGCEVVELYTEPDGTFPHHMPNPLKAENMVDLQATVRATGAEIGIGLDGDGDRCGVVDDQGDILWPDEYLVFLARRALANGPTSVIFDVKCSLALIEDIRRHGGNPVMSKTGYTNIAKTRQETRAALAGEFSGHIFFDDPVIDFDDGTFAGANLVEWLSGQSESLSAMRAKLPKYVASNEERYACPDAAKFAVIEAVRAHFKQRYETIDIDGVRIVFPNGWALVRASNTEPSLTSRFEATTPEGLREIMTMVKDKLREFPEVDLTREGH
ncbi:MAG: phosphomannomutase/phosphoglucomutase [Dehalococcoidia bacterium]|nr:phosphomannomutase/phosphoglucomutase [Dehalococcoidia bacterium]